MTASRRPRLGLVGWYGYGNVGDDLLLRVLHERLRPVAVFTGAPGTVDGYELRALEELPIWSRQLDLLVVGAGGLLNERYLEPMDLPGLGCPYGLLCLGVPHARWIGGLGDVLAGARFVTVRDHLARDLVQDAHPESHPWWLPDPAFVLALDRQKRRRTGLRPRIVLVPREVPKGWLREDDAPSATRLQLDAMNALVEAHRARADFRALVFEERDRPLLASLSCEGHVVGPDAALRELGAATGVVSTRLHGAIVAACRGIPLAIVDYQDKMLGLARLLGIEDSCLRFSALSRLPDLVEPWLDDARPPRPDARVVAYGALVSRALGFLAAS